jgi:hypothetical protein
MHPGADSSGAEERTPMRVLLSLAGLLIVVFTVMQLVKTQLGGLSSLTGGQPQGASAAGAAGTAATPRDVSRDIAGQISGAMQAGAAARASEPE